MPGSQAAPGCEGKPPRARGCVTPENVSDLAAARHKQRLAVAGAHAAKDDATHHDMAVMVCLYLSIGDHAPVYSNGAFWLPGEDGLYRRSSHEQIYVVIAELLGGRKLCRKHSDFKQIAEQLAALIEDESFFDGAPLGVASPGGFHTLGSGGSVETVPLSLTHRQTFAVAYAPDYEAEAPLTERLLADAFAGDDPEGQVDLFWQAAGAAVLGLMPKLQLVLLMLGRERSGKSLLQRLMGARIPPGRCVCRVARELGPRVPRRGAGRQALQCGRRVGREAGDTGGEL
jgi:hypothetical protein